jgi:hypothetical protein
VERRGVKGNAVTLPRDSMGKVEPEIARHFARAS